MRWFFDLNRYNDDDDSDIIGLTYKVNKFEQQPKLLPWLNEGEIGQALQTAHSFQK